MSAAETAGLFEACSLYKREVERLRGREMDGGRKGGRGGEGGREGGRSEMEKDERRDGDRKSRIRP